MDTYLFKAGGNVFGPNALALFMRSVMTSRQWQSHTFGSSIYRPDAMPNR